MIDELKKRLGPLRTSDALADAVSTAVRDGVFAAGMSLPTIRSVAKALEISPTTVSAAWTLLRRAGVIFTDGRRGSSIAGSSSPERFRRVQQYAARFDLDLSSGLPDASLLPDLGPALHRIPHVALVQRTYLDEPVIPDLVEVLRQDWPLQSQAMTLADGAMDGLDLVASCLLRYGDRVAVEEVTDPSLLDLLDAFGTKLIPLALDESGPTPESLGRALAAGARAVFLQPRAQHPTGRTVPAARRLELARLLSGTDTTLVEVDFAAGTASADPVSIGHAIPESTVHIRGFSTSHGPELRLAAVGGSSEFVNRLVQRRHLGQGWSSRLLQALLLDLLTDPRSIAQVAQARETYRRRRSGLVAALHARDVAAVGDDGLYAWVPVLSEATALVSLTSRGIGVAPGSPYQVRTPAAGFICVSAARVPDAEVEAVADALAEAALPRGATVPSIH